MSAFDRPPQRPYRPSGPSGLPFRPRRSDGPPSSAAPGPALDTSRWQTPWVWLKYHTAHPSVFPAMIRDASAGAKPGDWVNVYDKTGAPAGNEWWAAAPKAAGHPRPLVRGSSASRKSTS